jgi:hypothetical protein
VSGRMDLPRPQTHSNPDRPVLEIVVLAAMRAPPSGGGCRWREGIDSDAVAQPSSRLTRLASNLLPIVLAEVVAAEIGVRAVILKEVVNSDLSTVMRIS